MHGHHFWQEYESTGYGCESSARGQLNRESECLPGPRSRLRIRSRETGSSVPSRVSVIFFHTQALSGACSRESSRFPSAAASIFTVNRHRVSPDFISGHATEYRWPLLPRVRRHRAGSPKGSFNDGCCLFRYHHGSFFVHFSFPTATIDMQWTCIKSAIQRNCRRRYVTLVHIFCFPSYILSFVSIRF